MFPIAAEVAIVRVRTKVLGGGCCWEQLLDGIKVRQKKG